MSSADIASLGIAVDSRQVATAKDALTGLAAAARPAVQASQALTKATDDTAHSHAGLSTQAMAAQHSIRSMVEALASGQPVSQVFAQQINHLSYAATGPGGLSGAFKQAGSAMLGLFSPTMLVAGGLAAVAAAAAVTYASIAKTEIQFDDTSRAIGTTITQLHALESAASFKGIDTKDFLAAMDKFGASVYDAQNHMGSLADLFRANGVSANTTNGYLERTADLIKNAANDQQRLQILQQAGLPATMQWVDFMRQGADGIRKAAAEYSGLGDAADRNLVAKARAFDDAWNKGWKNFANYAKSAFITAADGFTTLMDKARQWDESHGIPTDLSGSQYADGSTLVDRVTGKAPVGANAVVAKGFSTLGNYNNPALTSDLQNRANQINTPKPTVDPNVVKDQISKQQQYIGLLGQTASAEDAVRQVQLARQSASLNGVNITNAQEKALENLAREQAIGVTAIKASTDAQNVEANTIGMSVGQAAEYTAAQNAINAAKQRGMPLTQANIDQIRAEASVLGQAAQNTDLLKFAYTGFVQGPLQAFQQSLSQGAKFFDALKAAGMSALNALSSKLADMAAQNLWKAALGGSSGSLSSLLGAAFGTGGTSVGETSAAAGASSGMMGGVPFQIIGAGVNHTGYGPGDSFPTRYVHPAHFDDAPRFHTGIGPGERAAIIRNDESVLTPGQMKALGKSGGDGSTSVNITQNLTFNGADPGTEARMRSYVDQSSKQAVQSAVQQVSQIKSTTPSYLKGGR